MNIDFVIVNWNSDKQLENAVRSLNKLPSDVNINVFIVDNYSADGSIDFLKKYKAEKFNIVLIENKYNNGFGAACNQGAFQGKSEYILFFNPDAMIIDDSFSSLVDFMKSEESRKYDVVGAQLVDEHGTVMRSCARFPTFSMFFFMAFGLDRFSCFKKFNMHMTDWDHGCNKKVDHVIGAFYLIRRSVFEKVNGFDERFFVYLEDLDLSLMVKKNGGDVYYLSDCKAFHEGGGASKKVKANRLFYTLRSRIIYGFKHYNFLSAWALFFLTIFIEPLTRLIFSLLSGGLEEFRNTLKGYSLLYKALPSIIKGQGR